MAAPRYPGAHFIRSPETAGRLRTATLGMVWHFTVGHEPGDVKVLGGPDARGVSSTWYIPKDGTTPTPGKGVYQFTETDEKSNHGFHTANSIMLSVEMESSGEGWTPRQIEEAVELGAWASNLYDIPIIHCNPTQASLASFRGHCGHRDLDGVDGNNHSDTVTTPPGWDEFLRLMSGGQLEKAYYFEAQAYDAGGVGPKILGSEDGYALLRVRDEKYEQVKAANPDLQVTKYGGDDDRFYIFGWGNPAGRDWYRSGNFATEEGRKVEMDKRVKNLPADANDLRKFRGKHNSRLPWPKVN